MPQSEGGYVSLGNGGPKSVYNATTEPTGPPSVFESVKRAIGQVVGNNNDNSQDTALLAPKGMQPMVVGSRDRDKIGKTLLTTKMPSAPTQTAEEARLLGTMPIDPMDDIELRSVQLQFPNARGSILEGCEQRRIPTDKGDILVAVQGDQSKPPILTYHDLGLNYATSFAGFFNYPVMRGLLENFCVYHVTAPGQEEGSPTLPEDYTYPTMDELAAQILFVMSQYKLKSIIGFGVGAGANILARFALSNPDKVGALCLINCVSTASGWIEWGYQSFNARYLRTKGMTQTVVEYLMWHHFGRNPEERNHDLAQLFKTHFERGVNPTNLAMFINSYIHRNDLNIARTPPQNGPQSAATLKMPVINVTGALSPHVDDTVTLNGRLDPTNSTWMKISDCAMVLEEQPGKLAEAFRLFLQGEGYATPISTPASTPTSATGGIINRFFQSYPASASSGLRGATNNRTTNVMNENYRTTNLGGGANFRNANELLDNGNTTNNNNVVAVAADLFGNLEDDDDDEEYNNEPDHNLVDNYQNNGGGVMISTAVSTKIRITENPIPETVAC